MPCNLRARFHLSHGERSALKAPGEGFIPIYQAFTPSPQPSPAREPLRRTTSVRLPGEGAMPQPFEAEFQPSESVAHESLFPRFGISRLLDSRLRGNDKRGSVPAFPTGLIPLQQDAACGHRALMGWSAPPRKSWAMRGSARMLAAVSSMRVWPCSSTRP